MKQGGGSEGVEVKWTCNAYFIQFQEHAKNVSRMKLTATDVPQKLRSEGFGTRVGPFDVDKDATVVRVGFNVGLGEMLGSIVGMPTILHAVNV